MTKLAYDNNRQVKLTEVINANPFGRTCMSSEPCTSRRDGARMFVICNHHA